MQCGSGRRRGRLILLLPAFFGRYRYLVIPIGMEEVRIRMMRQAGGASRAWWRHQKIAALLW